MLMLIMLPTIVAQATWINGYVRGAEGKPIPGATVRAAGVFETSTTTDASGYYKLRLGAGEWTITASYDTFEQATTIILADGEHKIVDFTIGTYVTVHTTTKGAATRAWSFVKSWRNRFLFEEPCFLSDVFEWLPNNRGIMADLAIDIEFFTDSMGLLLRL